MNGTCDDPDCTKPHLSMAAVEEIKKANRNLRQAAKKKVAAAPKAKPGRDRKKKYRKDKSGTPRRMSSA